MTQEEINKKILDNWDKEGLANGWVNEHIKNNELKQQVEYLQSKIDNAIEYCKEVIKEHNNGEYNVSTVELAIKEHKGNIENVLDILKEDK